jgi:hypothetical protein
MSSELPNSRLGYAKRDEMLTLKPDIKVSPLMPDLVIAVALGFERLGLDVVTDVRSKPRLARETVWRIPPDINVARLRPHIRKIRGQDLAVLNKRRAGNRGKTKIRKS